MSSFVTGLLEGATPGVGKAAGKVRKRLSSKGGESSGGYGTPATGGEDPGLRKGGKVRKTRSYKLHKGERVLTKKAAKRYEKRGSKR